MLKLKLAGMILLCGLLWAACQKSDVRGTGQPVPSEEKFFNSYAPVQTAAQTARDYVRQKNDRLPFTKQMMNKAGIPRWDKALVFEHVKLPTGRGNSLGDSGTVVHIPMVPENGHMVAGSLIVSMTPGDTTMNLVAAQDYASYGFGSPEAGHWNAHDVFTVLTRLDNLVFGRTAYLVNDGRIVGDSQQVRHLVTIDQAPATPTLNNLFVTLNVCNTQTVCVIAGEPGSGSGVCSTYVYCTTYYIEYPDGGGGGSGGGTGGGPTGGGGGTGGTGGGLGGGWVPWEDGSGSCITNELFASVVASGSPLSVNEGSNLLSSSTTTRTKSYKWKFFAIETALFGVRFSSTEIGTHVLDPLTFSWKWESLTHSHINKSGTSILWAAQCNNLVPTPSIYVIPLGGGGYSINIAEMKLNYDIQISYVCDLLNLESNNNYNSSKSWDIND